MDWPAWPVQPEVLLLQELQYVARIEGPWEATGYETRQGGPHDSGNAPTRDPSQRRLVDDGADYTQRPWLPWLAARSMQAHGRGILRRAGRVVSRCVRCGLPREGVQSQWGSSGCGMRE